MRVIEPLSARELELGRAKFMRVEGVVEVDVCDPKGLGRVRVHHRVVRGDDLGKGTFVLDDVPNQLQRLSEQLQVCLRTNRSIDPVVEVRLTGELG